jgi:hypothetical protein
LLPTASPAEKNTFCCTSSGSGPTNSMSLNGRFLIFGQESSARTAPRYTIASTHTRAMK